MCSFFSGQLPQLTRFTFIAQGHFFRDFPDLQLKSYNPPTAIHSRVSLCNYTPNYVVILLNVCLRP